MIRQIKEALDLLFACAEAGERSGALRAVAQFAVLFDEFLRQNKQYIFAYEAANLNNCMKKMLAAMENKDFRGLIEIIQSSFINFLDDWDFDNKKLN